MRPSSAPSASRIAPWDRERPRAGGRPARVEVGHAEASRTDDAGTQPPCSKTAHKPDHDRKSEQADVRGRVDAGPAARYAVALRDRGLSAQDIAAASGISVTLVRRLLKPPGLRPVKVSRETSDAVRGVPLPPADSPVPLAGRGRVEAAPAARQLTVLAERGWPARHLAARLCVNEHTVSAIRDGRHAHISIAIDQRIQRLYRELRDSDPVAAGVRPGDAARVRTWAVRRARST
ncbi:hypothetical protein [Streptomyces sp. RKAG337]|uniref:hypothetical protein n=1 Tax=Streptomyces sp. RKAG337 TaxID=2893404 RepID=UPI0020335B9D|nr:hypothetical protein [Streptomyces sp. RKAG337]MCM2431062.1 hypothetical protein [Streptomyces sp. RKAG337]